MKPHFLHPALLWLLALGNGLFGASAAAAGVVEEGQPPVVPGAGLFIPGAIPRLRIELDLAAVESLRQKPRKFVAATVSEGETVYPRVGVHLKGSVGSFDTIDGKPSLTLDFRHFTRGGAFHGLRRVHLNNAAEDPSYASEKLGSELFEAAGVPAPRVTRAVVALNGRACGLYVLKEGFTEDFLTTRFQQVCGELYEPAAGHDVDEPLKRNAVEAPFDKKAQALYRLAAAVQQPDPVQQWGKLDAVLDTRRFLTFMAMEVMLGHRDGYCLAGNNFRLYHDLDTDKMVFLPHGMDQLFGTADLPWQPRWAGRLPKAIMDVPEGRERYAQTFDLLFTNVFKLESLTNRVDELLHELRPVLGSPEWAEVCTASTALKEQIQNRKRCLSAQLNRPALKPLALREGVGHPEEWAMGESLAQCKVDQVLVEGLPMLHIAMSGEAVGTWCSTVILPRGEYRFEGRARTAGVAPLRYGVHQGAGLRIGGKIRQGRSLMGDAPWEILRADFAVEQPLQEVELICELRARAGEAWFDSRSLRVMRVEGL